MNYRVKEIIEFIKILERTYDCVVCVIFVALQVFFSFVIDGILVLVLINSQDCVNFLFFGLYALCI